MKIFPVRLLLSLFLCAATHTWPANLQPLVLAEETVYSFTDANNGAGPMWCHGSTCLVRVGEDVFASGLETIPEAKPLHNCRWVLFKRNTNGWERCKTDSTGRTREPSPLATFHNGPIYLSANPALKPDAYSGPAQPVIYRFNPANPAAGPEQLQPQWAGTPAFSEHSYRSFAADGLKRELILFQNIGYTHAEWSFLDAKGDWSAQGQLKWPFGAEYDKPQPIRICYPAVALQNRAVHFCGVSDIVEPYEKFRAFKKQLTGRDWDYDFRRLFYTWSPDITTGRFQEWVEIASRDKTCGWIMPCDLHVAPDRSVHILWTERAIDERLREKFFPDARQSHALNHALVKDGKIVSRRVLAGGSETGEVPSAGRFQVTPQGRVFVFYYVSGKNKQNQPVSENRLLEILPENASAAPVVVPLKHPMSSFFTATPRAGSALSQTLDLLGQRAGHPNTIAYARIQLGRNSND